MVSVFFSVTGTFPKRTVTTGSLILVTRNQSTAAKISDASLSPQLAVNLRFFISPFLSGLIYVCVLPSAYSESVSGVP